MAEDCCKTTEDGVTYCALPGTAQGKIENQVLMQPKNKASTFWHKIRGGAMFVVACLLSPCCTPLFVPLGLALVAGTPFAVWASLNVGWIYGGLTLLSIVSFVLGWRWLQTKKSVAPTPQITPANLPPNLSKAVESKGA